MALLTCPHRGSAGRDILPGLCFYCFSVNAFFPAWLPEAAPEALARQAWLKSEDNKSLVATAQGLYCDTTQHVDPSRKPPSKRFCSCRQAKQVWTSLAGAEVGNESEQTAEIRSSL